MTLLCYNAKFSSCDQGYKSIRYLLSGLSQKKITDPRIRKRRIDDCNKVQEKISRMKHKKNL